MGMTAADWHTGWARSRSTTRVPSPRLPPISTSPSRPTTEVHDPQGSLPQFVGDAQWMYPAWDCSERHEHSSRGLLACCDSSFVRCSCVGSPKHLFPPRVALGGWNNIRMVMETVIVLAFLSGAQRAGDKCGSNTGPDLRQRCNVWCGPCVWRQVEPWSCRRNSPCIS